MRKSESLTVLFLSVAVLLGCSDPAEKYVGMPEHVERRHLKLEGAPNFRDLGGYKTVDGRSVKWGLFFRSDNLHHLTDQDLARISDLGIRLVCDFRGPEEKAEEPDRLPASSPPRLAELEIWDPSFSAKGFREQMFSGDFDELDLGEILVEGNRLFATRFSPLYAEMFELIMQPKNLPAVVHCTAGKDRAGFASALILRVLGVPMETIYDDFLLTNFYTKEKIDRAVLITRLLTLFRASEEQLRAVMGVERRFLEAGFEEIDKQYGSFKNYRRNILGISDSALTAFRERSLMRPKSTFALLSFRSD